MNLDREWEKFTGGPFVAFQDRIHVTLDGKGKLLLNRNVHRLLGKPEAVMLYFNRKKDTIGISPAHARLAEAFPVRPSGESFVIYVGTFCRHFGIRLTTTEKFVRPDFDNDGILILELANTVTVSGYRSKRRQNRER